MRSASFPTAWARCRAPAECKAEMVDREIQPCRPRGTLAKDRLGEPLDEDLSPAVGHAAGAGLLPSRAPELKPVENIWPQMRAKWLLNPVVDTYDTIIEIRGEGGEGSRRNEALVHNTSASNPWRHMCAQRSPLGKGAHLAASQVKRASQVTEGMSRFGLVGLQDDFARRLFQPDGVAPEIGQMPQDPICTAGIEPDAVCDLVPQQEFAVTGKVHVHDLYVGVLPRDIVLPRESAAHLGIATLVVNRADDQVLLRTLIGETEEAELADQLGAQVLSNETLVAIVRPGVLQDAIGISATGHLRKHRLVLLAGLVQMRSMSCIIASPSA